jgi:hypothetical protein
MRTYLADALRGLTTAAVMLSAVIHLDLYEQGFRDISKIGPLFMLNFIGGIVLGVAVVVWRHWIPPFLAAGYGATTVIFYWISVIHGLFGIKENTTGWPEVLAQIAEYCAVAFGLAAAALLFLERRGYARSSDRAAERSRAWAPPYPSGRAR